MQRCKGTNGQKIKNYLLCFFAAYFSLDAQLLRSSGIEIDVK
jgi:hypothetical protein